MKQHWNTSTLPADLDWHAHNKPFRAYEMGASDPLDWPVIDYRPSDLARLGDVAPSIMPRRIQQSQERAKTWAYAAGTLICFAAIGVMLAWRG